MKQIISSVFASTLLMTGCSPDPQRVSELVSSTEQRLVALSTMRESDIQKILDSGLHQRTSCPTIFVTPENSYAGNSRQVIQIHPVIIGDPKKGHDYYYEKPMQKAVKWITGTKDGGVIIGYHPESFLTGDLLLDEITQRELNCNTSASIKGVPQDVFGSDHTSGVLEIKN